MVYARNEIIKISFQYRSIEITVYKDKNGCKVI